MQGARLVVLMLGVLMAIMLYPSMAVAQVTVPRSGAPIDRIDNLWQQTRPILRNDWNSSLVDAEATRRRNALTEAWMSLKTDLGREQAPANVRGIIHDVVGLIARVYSHASGTSTASSSSKTPTSSKTSSKGQSSGPGASVSIDTKLARIDQIIAAARAK